MKREHIKLMRPFSTLLIVKGQVEKRGNVLVFVRCVREKDGIIIRKDYGKYNRDIALEIKKKANGDGLYVPSPSSP